MSNQTEIARLGGARNKIRQKLVSMGLAQDTDKLDALAEKLDAIPILHGVQEVLDVNNPRCSIPAGYYGGEGEVGIALEEKTVTPTDTQQIITPSEGCVLSKVTVEAAESGGGSGGSVETCTITIRNVAKPPDPFTTEIDCNMWLTNIATNSVEQTLVSVPFGETVILTGYKNTTFSFNACDSSYKIIESGHCFMNGTPSSTSVICLTKDAVIEITGF